MIKQTILLLSLLAAAQAQTTAPATQPITPQVDQILTRLEKAGDAIKDLQAGVHHELYQIIPDDRQTKLGFIRFRAAAGKNDARFMISFDTLIHEDLKLRQKEWFCFNGKWFREIREQTKTAIDREVVAPDEKVDPFKLGEGPFPLPFGQKKADILKNFNVTWVKPEKIDPPATDHLILIPKPESRYVKKYEKLEFWVDQKLNLPIRIGSRDRHSNIITVNFKDIKINTGIPDNQLWIEIPEGYGYQKEPLENKMAT
jgi:outer membrane lipoprotein-sorting protein